MDALSLMEAHSAGRKTALTAPTAPPGDRGEMRKAAEAFEAQFLGHMFQLAMKDAPVDEVFGGGPGERMFRELLTDAWAESAVRSGGVGIADAVMRTMIQTQAENS